MPADETNGAINGLKGAADEHERRVVAVAGRKVACASCGDAASRNPIQSAPPSRRPPETHMGTLTNQMFARNPHVAMLPDLWRRGMQLLEERMVSMYGPVA